MQTVETGLTKSSDCYLMQKQTIRCRCHMRRTQLGAGSNSKHVVEATGSFGAPRSCTDETYERVTHLMFNLSLEVKLRLSLSPALSRPITKMGEIIQILRFGLVAIYA